MIKELAFSNISAATEYEMNDGNGAAFHSKGEWCEIDNTLPIGISSVVKKLSCHFLVCYSLSGK